MAGCVEPGLRFETERLENCPLCGSSETRIWRENCRDWQQPEARGRFRYERCATCRAHFLAVRPTEADAGHVYFAGYGPHHVDDERPSGSRVGAAVLALLGRRLARRMEQTYTPEREGEILVDYGCGTPTFLDEARARGFTTLGVDFVEQVTEAVRARGHKGLLAREFARGVADESVACLRMSHVIEHLYHPHDVLRVIHAKMRPGGRIHVSTPNPSSIGSMMFRRRWYPLQCPRHVVMYEPTVLRELLKNVGFKGISVVHEIGAKDLSRSWEIVRYDNGKASHEAIEAKASDPIRAALMLPAASVGSLLGRADRYHVFARRA